VGDESVTAAEALAELVKDRDRAATEVDGIEAEQRAAIAAAQRASEELVELERTGASAAARKKAEAVLSERRATADAPWSERAAGGRARVADRQAEVRAFAAANLHELVNEVEARGQQAAADVVAAAGQLLAAFARREQAATELGALVTLAGGRVHPADVGPPSQADAAAAACERLTESGEPSPRLRRFPDQPRHSTVDSAEAVPA
jgi:hypothetical protein